MMWSIYAVLICFCLEDFGLLGGSLLQCVWLWSQLCLRIWDLSCELSVQIQWALFAVSGYLWAVWSLCVRNKTSHVLGCEVSVQELRIWKLADLILKPGTWHADCVLLSISLVSWNLNIYHNWYNGASAHLGGYLWMLAMCIKGLAPDCPSANVFWAPAMDLSTIQGVCDRTKLTKSLLS